MCEINERISIKFGAAVSSQFEFLLLSPHYNLYLLHKKFIQIFIDF
jgi:hypothetical protein